MSKFNVQLARRDDLAGVLTLYRELRPQDPAIDSTKANAVWAGMLNNQGLAVVVAECEGVLAATCMLACIDNLANSGRPFGVIEHVVTAARFRRRGIGRAVLAFALQHAWSKNCCKVMLLSGVQRTEAHKVYESLGFNGDVERGFVVKAP